MSVMLDRHDLSDLFENGRLVSFSEDPREHVPKTGSMIYTVWDKHGRFIYVGICGIQKHPKDRNPLSRILSHASGRRSGDQFCIYVHDFFVIPELFKSRKYEPSKGTLDQLTKQYIHSHLFYRFLSLTTPDSDIVVRKLEKKIRAGKLGMKPFLNPL